MKQKNVIDSNGKIIANGTPKELKEKYGVDNLESAFLKAGGFLK